MPRRLLLIHMLLAALLCSCAGGGDDAAVPRRRAYPRPAAPDTAYVALDSLPVRFLVNASASVVSRSATSGSRSVDIAYPQYGATVYCTFLPVAPSGFKDAADNRLERIYLNLHGADPDVRTVVNDAGFLTLLVTAPAAKSTPVQFLAYDEDKPDLLVSGAAFFHNVNHDSPVDSLAPMVDAIGRDIRRALTSLAYK